MHKRLQRKIAEARQINHGRQALASPKRSASVLDDKLLDKGKGVTAPRSDDEDRSSSTHLNGKRKYAKHPKLDHNTPATPRSAYVIFANSKCPMSHSFLALKANDRDAGGPKG